MKPKFKIFYYLLLIALIIVSCKKDDDSVTPLPETLLSGELSIELFDTTYTLTANALDDGLTGVWQVTSNSDEYNLSNSDEPNCLFTGKLLGEYMLTWTVSNGKEEKSENLEINIVGFTDNRDNVQYRAIKIGNQIWMAENLKTTSYLNGDAITDGSSVGDYSGEASPKYWFAYNDDLANVETYGRLYTWYVVDDSRGLAPEGWHIPSDDEWNIMQVILGMSAGELNLICDDGNNIAGKIKELGTSHWASPNIATSNDYGFSALPAGIRRRYNKEFQKIGEYACFWSSDEENIDEGWYRHLYNNEEFICRTANYKNYGFSVRCVKD